MFVANSQLFGSTVPVYHPNRWCTLENPYKIYHPSSHAIIVRDAPYIITTGIRAGGFGPETDNKMMTDT